MGAREPPYPIPQIYSPRQAVGRKPVPPEPSNQRRPPADASGQEPPPHPADRQSGVGTPGTPAQNTPPTSLAPPFRGLTILPQKDRQGGRGWGVEGNQYASARVWTPGRDPARAAHPAPLEINRLHVSAPTRATTARVDRVASPEPGSAPLLEGGGDPSPIPPDSVGGGGNVQAGASVMGFLPFPPTPPLVPQLLQPVRNRTLRMPRRLPTANGSDATRLAYSAAFLRLSARAATNQKGRGRGSGRSAASRCSESGGIYSGTLTNPGSQEPRCVYYRPNP